MQIQTESKKTQHYIDQVVVLRLLVGYLGQGKQSSWWDCNFLDATGQRFLETTFPRTAKQAALRATADAACLTHDKALGRIGCYHLFRLPPALEDLVETGYNRIDWTLAFKDIASRESAFTKIESLDTANINAPVGPVQVGFSNKILTSTAIGELAAHYNSAFKDDVQCFPYFAEDRNENR